MISIDVELEAIESATFMASKQDVKSIPPGTKFRVQITQIDETT